jgi:hypothetical protein
VRKLALTVVAVMLIGLPAQADEEPLPLPAVPSWTVAHWRQAWAATAVHSLSLDSLADWRFMRDTYFPGPEPRSLPGATRKAQERQNPPAVTRQAYPPGVEQWRALVTFYWPPELVEWALAIMNCESHGNPWAENPYSSAAGLFQFLRSTWDRGPAPALGLGTYDSGAVFNPELNIRAAAWLYANWGGTSQWSCKA